MKEPYVFEDEADRQQMQGIVERWHLMLSLRAAAKGWAYDRLSDFARILRIPGTANMKDPANPKPVRVVSHDTGRRYNLCDFEEFLDDAAIPNLEAQERAARVWADKFRDVPLAINLSATIPQDLVDTWMDPSQSADPQVAMRFKNTWLRQRHDLKDQSQSGYDLALADFGVVAGLSEQQIVDLIIHHRAMHRQKQRNKPDYFQRTIAKALSRNPDAPGPRVEEQAAAGQVATAALASAPAAGPAEPEKGMSIEDRKAALCEQISKAFALRSGNGDAIRITRLVKITGKDPSFRMELDEGTKIEFPNIGKFIDQNYVRLAIAAQINWMMPKIKPRDWERLKDEMLAACFEEDGPIEAQWEDAARDTVCRYLEENEVHRELADDAPAQHRALPVVMWGRITINTTHFQSWVNKTTFQNLAVKAIAAMLSAMGAEQRTVCITPRIKQSRWLLPVEYFNPPDYVQAEEEVQQRV